MKIRRMVWAVAVTLVAVASGYADFGEMKSRGFARPTTASHCEWFFNYQPMTLARWPNEGASEKVAGLPKGSGKNDARMR